MSWPRKNETARVYQDRKDKSFLIIFPDNLNPAGDYDGVGNVYPNDTPILASCCISPAFIRNLYRRVQWSDMPRHWQKALCLWLPKSPKHCRGLWKMDVVVS